MTLYRYAVRDFRGKPTSRQVAVLLDRDETGDLVVMSVDGEDITEIIHPLVHHDLCEALEKETR